MSGDPDGRVCEGEGAAWALSHLGLFCIPHSAPLCLAAHPGRSVRSSAHQLAQDYGTSGMAWAHDRQAIVKAVQPGVRLPS